MRKQRSERRYTSGLQVGSIKPVLLSLACFGIFGVSIGVALFGQPVREDQSSTDAVSKTSPTVKTFEINTDGIISGQSLGVSGQLRVNNTLVLSPSSQPTQTTTGELYFDQSQKQVRYFDGSSYQEIASTNDIKEALQQQPAARTDAGNVTNIIQQYLTQQTINNYESADAALQTNNNVFTGINTFTAPSAFDQVSVTNFAASGAAALQGSLTVSGATLLGSTSASSLLLSSALGVASGGTGASSFTSNEIVIGQGTGALTTIPNGAPGLCLLSTATAPQFQTCPGGAAAGVDSLVGLTGTLSIANASAAGSTITIDTASSSAKGLASFNASNLTVTNGNVNTIQDISVSSAPTFSGLTLTAPLSVASGGTGVSSTQAAINSLSQLTTAGDLLYFNGSNSNRLARGANGQCLTSSVASIAWSSCGPGEADTLASVTGRGATTNTALLLQGGATSRGLTIDTSSSSDDTISITVTGGGVSRYTGQITAEDLTANRTWTLPDASGTFCIQGSSTCGFASSTGSGSYIQNQNSSQQSGSNYWISGTGRADLGLQAPSLDTATATALNIGSTNATILSLNQDSVLAATKSLTITGGTTGTRPLAPTEGMVYYDSSTKQLITYANGKWQSDRSDAVLVAASDSTQAEKDAADFITDGNTATANDGDQVQINAALTAASGKKVVLLAGTYILDSYIAVPNNTMLVGTGTASHVILADGLNANLSIIYGQDSVNGSGVVIQDLLLDGNSANQTSGATTGISLYHFGEGTGPSARVSARIMNVTIQNMRKNGIQIEDSSRVSITGNTTRDNEGSGISLLRVSDSTLGGNISIGNSYDGVALNGTTNSVVTGTIAKSNSGNGILLTAGSDSNTISANNLSANGNAGIMVQGSSRSSVSGNTVSQNTASGISVQEGANDNIVSSNKISNNGSATQNNGIFMWSVTGNQLTNNSISDDSATGTNYAINLYDSSVDSSYLAGNTIASGTIHNLATATSFGGQLDASGNYVIQPGGSIELLKDANITGSLAVSGVATVSSGQLTLGSPTQQGQLAISDGSSNTATLAVGDLSGNFTYTIPVTSANDTFCLLTIGNCSGGVAIVGSLDGGTANATGASIVGATLYLQSASGTNPGLVNTTTQTFAGNKTFTGNLSVQDVTVGAGKSISFVGGITSTRPASPSDGTVYFDTTTKQLITYANGKWQADRSNSTVIVAANDSKNKDAADYVVSSADEAAGNADVAIQAAIASIPANGGSVYLMEGTYTIDTGLTLSSNTTFTGAGRNLTILKLKSAYNANINLFNIDSGFTYRNNIVIKDLTIDGNKANQTAGTQYGIYTYRLGNQTTTTVGLSVSNVYIKDMRSNGMFIEQSANSKISNSYFMTNGGAGIYENSSSSRNSFTNNTSRENGGIGIDSEGSYDIISDNFSQGNTSHGIDTYGSSAQITSNMVTNNGGVGINSTGTEAVITANTINSNTSRGLVIDQNAKVTDNVIQSNGSSGIYTQYLNNAATISNNTIRLNTGNGIDFNRGGSNSSITGNTIESNTAAGIDIHGYLYQLVSGNVISSNYIGSNATYGITLSSVAHASVTGNTLVNNGGTTTNNAIRVNSPYSGDITISNNSITDTSCTTTCYSIALEDGREIALSANTIGDATLNGIGSYNLGQGEILDNATSTTYSNQRDGNGNLINRGSGALGINTKTITTSLTLQGGMSNTQLPSPSQPSVGRVGTGGTSTYGYKVTALDGTGETLPSTERVITNGNAILDGTNYNTVSWTELPGAVQYKVYRTTTNGSPATTGLIATITGGANITFSDTGIAAGVAAPVANTTGGATIAGNIQGSSASLSGAVTIAGATSLNGPVTATNTVLFKNTTNSSSAFILQDSASLALFTADTSAKKITIRTLDVAYNLTVAGHIISGGAAPTIVADAAACATPTVSVTGTDTAGVILVITGTACAAPGTIATINFSTVFGAAPNITLTPSSAAAAGLGVYIDDATLTTSSFKIGSSTTPTDATTYKWYYHALQ